jgi:nitrogen-specific signal transduction histidine kinase
MLLTFSGLTGDEVIRLNASPSDPAWNIHKHIAHELKVPLQSLRVVLPDGQLLASACSANQGASLADVIEIRKRRRLT